MRFIKPSQFFYDKLMSIWIRFVKTLDRQMTLNELKMAFRQRIAECKEMRQIWKPEFDKPTKIFINFVLEEHQRQVKLMLQTKDVEEQKQHSLLFFERMQMRLAQLWESDIVEKGSKFQAASSSIEIK